MLKLQLTLLLSLLLLSKSNCQQFYIPDLNSEWGQIRSYGPPTLSGSGAKGSIFKPEIQEVNYYNKSYQYWAGVCTRYENGRLYMLDIENSTDDSIVETIYYDFNLEVNDKFLIPSPNYEIYASVISVSTFTDLLGINRKKIDLACQGLSRMEWIEGIGDIGNGVLYLEQFGRYDINDKVVCYSNYMGNVFKEPLFNYPCEDLNNYKIINTGIDKDNGLKTDVKIFPDPVTDRLIIESNLQYSKIRVISLYGQRLIESINKTIDCSKLTKGIYVLELTSDKNEITFMKFLKK